MQRVEELLTICRSKDLPVQEVAEAEDELWGVLYDGLSSEEKTMGRGSTFARRFGLSSHDVSARLLISRSGVSHLLWPRLDSKQMGYNASTVILRTARKWGGDFEDNVVIALAAYDAQLEKGFVRRVGGYRYATGWKALAEKLRKERDTAPAAGAEGSSNTRHFLRDIRNRTTKFVQEQLKEGPRSVQEEVADEFFYGLQVLIEELKRNLERGKKAGEVLEQLSAEGITRRQVSEAVLVLGGQYDPKKALDIQDLRRRYRRLAAQFHPDRSQDPNAVKQYHAVTEAWRVIREFADGE